MARHFFLAGQAEDALKYLDAALRFLQGELGSQSALELIEMVLAPTDLVAGGERVAILAKKFSLLDLLGRAAEKEVVVGELRTLAESLAEPEYRALCERLEGSLWMSEGRALDALDAFERALNHAGKALSLIHI